VPMCRVMRVHRSGFYAWMKNPQSVRGKEDLRLLQLIRKSYDESNSIYRYIKQALSEKKITCPGTGEEIREYIYVKDVAKLSIDVLADEYKNTHVTITGQHPTRYRDMILTIKEMLGGDIDVEFNPPEENSAHYTRTPYSFTPKLGNKLVSNYYVDLGQGLLECAEDVKRSLDEGKDA